MKQGIHLFIILLAIVFVAKQVIGQSKFELPKNIELKTREDYAKYEGTIIGAQKWMEETDLDQQMGKT